MSVASSTVQYWDRLPRWGREVNDANRRRIEETLALVPTGIRTVLDVGAGDGTVSNPLVAAGCDVTGVDISSAALEHFAGKALVSPSDALPFPDASFDLVICAEVLEHLPAGVYERSLREIERVAARYVIVTTPNEEYLPAGFVKCAACGTEFHMNLHVRTFDRSVHANLFASLVPRNTVQIDHWSHSEMQTSVEHKLFGLYRTPVKIVCPCCHGDVCVDRRLGRMGRGLLRMTRSLTRRLEGRPKPRWIGTLYERTGAAT